MYQQNMAEVRIATKQQALLAKGSKNMENTQPTVKRSKVCKVSGGGLPDGFEAKVDVEIDYTGLSQDIILDKAMSHDMISVQRVLRAKTTGELNELAKTGYKTKSSAAGRATVNVTAAYRGRFAGMSQEEQLAELRELQELAKNAKSEKDE